MKITVDTNVLVRAVVQDDPVQASVAAKVLIDAEKGEIVLNGDFKRDSLEATVNLANAFFINNINVSLIHDEKKEDKNG